MSGYAPTKPGLSLCPQLFPDDQQRPSTSGLTSAPGPGSSVPGLGLGLRGTPGRASELPGPTGCSVGVAGSSGGLSTCPPPRHRLWRLWHWRRPGLQVGALRSRCWQLLLPACLCPFCIVLRAHLQLHVAPRASHLLLPGLVRSASTAWVSPTAAAAEQGEGSFRQGVCGTGVLGREPQLHPPAQAAFPCRLPPAGLLAAGFTASSLCPPPALEFFPVYRLLHSRWVPGSGEGKAGEGQA